LRFGKSWTRAVRESRAWGSSCRERERGVALVEFTLIMPFLLILVVGIIDFGLVFSDVIGVRQGARDGGRQASVGQFGSDTSCQLFLSGPISNEAKALMCLTKAQDDAPDHRTRVRIFVGDGSTGPAYAVGKPIAICEQYLMKSITGVMPALTNPVHDRVFTTRTVFRIETVRPGFAPGTGTVVASEDPLPGHTWSCAPPSAVT
jgi:Flp pilus assembly protein TadG